MSLAGMIKQVAAGPAFEETVERQDVLLTDEALVAAVRRGDDRAFERLYARYQRRVAAYVYGMVQDHGRAEDVTQEVFISALRRMRQTERPIAFKPWVYEIAKNACIDQFRRSRRAEEVSLEAGQDSGAIDTARLAAATPTPADAVDAKQQLDDLCGAFGGLSDTHHQILVLRELEGLSYREIGDRLSLSRPSVESTLFRARRRLTEEYEELVSGERCRTVQAMVAGGASAIGTRDKRRLARHVAHCQPCRRQAHLAGLDTRTLTGTLRDAAGRRVAALLPLPLPALLRLRRGGGDPSGTATSWAGPATSMAEPAVNWVKAALVTAAMVTAGGAGVAGHGDTQAPASLRGAPAPVAERSAQMRPAQAASVVAAPVADAPPRTAPGARAGLGDRDATRRVVVRAADRLRRAERPSRPAATAPERPAPAAGAAPAVPAATTPDRLAPDRPAPAAGAAPAVPAAPIAAPDLPAAPATEPQLPKATQAPAALEAAHEHATEQVQPDVPALAAEAVRQVEGVATGVEQQVGQAAAGVSGSLTP